MRLHHHSFWKVSFLCEHGVNEEKEKARRQSRNLLGRGVDVREGRKKRRKKGSRWIGRLQECYVYLAEWLEARTQPSHPPIVNCVSGEESSKLV